jgi:hypothetical protein
VDYRRYIGWTLSDGEGEKTVYAMFWDAHGLASAPVCDTIILDTTPPAGAVSINGGAAYTNSTAVVLELHAWDRYGVAGMKLGGRADLAGADWVPFCSTAAWTLPAGNGERAVFAMFCSTLGQTSDPASDSIILDTEPPSAGLSLNGGARFTNSTVVSVWMNASDNFGISSMERAGDPALAGASRGAFQEHSYWTLEPVEGEHRLYARVWDVAGNPSGIVSAAMVLDTAPPKVRIEVPSSVEGYFIGVNHSFSDDVSYMAYYEIEVRDNDGPWTQMIRTDAGNGSALSVFVGKDGHTYSFRIRACDNAGNLGPFVVAGNMTTVNIPAPAVTITHPSADATVKGELQARGTAFPRNGPAVLEVLVRLDGGEWMPANGTGNWTMDFDTRSLRNGPHTITARAYDGVKYSDEVERVFVVRNPAREPSVWTGGDIWWILLLIAVVAGAAGYAMYRSARKKREDDGMD